LAAVRSPGCGQGEANPTHRPLENPSVASDRWYREAVAQASQRGELRLVMNLEALVKSDYFRSYWIQRNASVVRRYWTGISDVKRSAGNIDEHRVFLRLPTTAPAAKPIWKHASTSSADQFVDH
jgi:hypothetical protein